MKTNTVQKNIPSGWKESDLGGFLVILKGKLPKRTYDVSDDNSVPYLSIKYLDGAEFKYAHKSDGVIASENDLLVVADGSGSGRMYRGYSGLVSSTFIKITSKSPSEVSNDYLEALFSHLDFMNPRFRKGGAIPHFDFKQLKEVDVLIPPIKEQQKIAEILGGVDKDIAKTQEVIGATEKLKRGLMQQLFTRGIGHTKFKETKLGQIAESWTSESLRILINVKHGFAFKGEYFTDYETENILLTPVNFKIGGGFNYERFKYYQGVTTEDYILKSGELILSMTDLSKAGDTLGYPALIPEGGSKKYLHNQRLGKVELKSDKVNLSFIYWRLMGQDYRKHILSTATGTTVRHTSPSKIQEFEFALPSLPEQKQIAEILSAVDQKISVNKKLKEKLTLLKKGLMQDLLSGKVRTNI